jgi:hypothetical protein
MSSLSSNCPGSDTIPAFDEQGHAIFVPRAQWAQEVLPESLKAAWEEPDKLRTHILVALNDGFADLLLPAAQRLAAIDPQKERGAATLALVQLENHLTDEAAATLRHCLDATY